MLPIDRDSKKAVLAKLCLWEAWAAARQGGCLLSLQLRMFALR